MAQAAAALAALHGALGGNAPSGMDHPGAKLVGFMQQLGLNPRKPLKLDGDLYAYRRHCGSDMPRETVISKWELALTNQNIDPTDWTKLVVDNFDWQVFSPSCRQATSNTQTWLPCHERTSSATF
jgi:hypothetical protein